MGDISTLLDSLLSPDNDSRRRAEQAKDELAAANPALLVGQLAAAVAAAPAAAHRAMAAVVLRRVVSRDGELWGRLAPETREALKAALLQSLVGEAQDDVRRKVCHAVAEVAILAAGPGANDWPALLPAIFSLCGDAAEPKRREASLFMFATLIEFTRDGIVGPHCAELQQILARLLVDPVPAVALGALKACAAMVTALDDDAQRDRFQAFVPQMLKVLEATLSASASGGDDADEQPAREVLKALIDVVQEHPSVLRPHIEAVCHAMLVIVSRDSFESETRQLGLEFLLSLAEEAGATVRKLPALVNHVLTLGLRFLADVEEDPEWVRRDDDPKSFNGDEPDQECSELVQAGINAVQRLADAVRGKVFLPCFISDSHWHRLSRSADWRERRAAVLAFCLLLSGCKRELAPAIGGAVAQILPFLQDPHQRVRHAAVRCLGQMALEFSDPDELTGGSNDSVGLMAESVVAAARSRGSTGAEGGAGSMARAARSAARVVPKSIQDAAMDVMLPPLVQAVADGANAPRVRGLACAALSNLLDPDYCTAEHIGAQAPHLLGALFALVGGLPEQFLQSRGNALEAMSHAAMCLDEEFIPFYAQVAAALKGALATPATTQAQIVFRCKSISCLSSVCEAVGKATAGIDAAEATNFIIRATSAGFAKEDTDSFRTMSYALVRLAECLGSDFEPYFQFAFRPLLDKASSVVDITWTAGGSDADCAGATHASPASTLSAAGSASSPAGVAATPPTPPGGGETVMVTFEGQRHNIAIDSEQLEDKSVALRCLMVLIADMGVSTPAYWRIVDTLAPALIAAINEQFSNVREIGFEAIEPLLRCAVADTTDRTHGSRMMEQLVPAITRRLGRERQPACLRDLCSAACDAFRLAWRSTTATFNGPDEERKAAEARSAAREAGVALGVNAGAGADVAHKYGPVSIPLAHVHALFQSVRSAYEGSASRRQAMVEKIEANADVDDQDQERLEEELGDEDTVITNLTDIVGYCIKVHGRAVLPLLAQPGGAEDEPALGAYMLQWLDKREDVHVPMRAAAVCLLDDLIEFASPDAQALMPHLLPHLRECLAHENPLLRQPTAYGIGVCAQHAGDSLAPRVPELFEQLRAVINAEDSRSGEMHGATDNAVSALLKLARFRPQQVSRDSVMPGVLAYLPMREDAIEARLVHSWMVDGLISGDPLWVGAGGSQAPQVLRCVARCLVLHNAREVAQNGADDSGADDADEEGDDELLFEDASITKLRAFAAAVRANQQQATLVAGVVSVLAAKEAAALKALGFPSA